MDDNTLLTCTTEGSIGMFTQDYMFDLDGMEKLPEKMVTCNENAF